MTTPAAPVVDPTDLGTYLGITNIDTTRAAFILQQAQNLCLSVVNPLPAGADAVILDVATRAWSNPTNATSEGAGPFPVTWGVVAGGLWLTRQNKTTLRNLAGLSGAYTIDPTPVDAGTGLQPWDQNVTWLDGVPLAEDLGTGPLT